MSRHLSVATVIEKNLIASDKAFVLLLEIAIHDELGNFVENLRLARNSENVVYGPGEENPEPWLAANFSFDLKMDTTSDPTLNIQADDPSGFIREKMDLYGGGIGFACKLLVVNTGNLAQAPEIEEVFEVIGASAEGYTVSFSLGVPNALTIRFPRRTQMRDQCPFLFKGVQCQYAGEAPSCSYSYDGANGCKAKGNQANFGGFRGLQSLG